MLEPRSLLVVVCWVALSAAPARAESSAPSSAAVGQPAAASSGAAGSEQAQAQALFDRALELASAGDFAAACKKLEQSLALHEGLGTRYHLAGCWQKAGRSASAYRMFEQVARRARDLGQPDREQAARARMAALAPKLTRLRIDVESRGARTEVYLDDALVPESEWRRPIPVDGGVHRVRVTAEGKTPWATQVDTDTPGTLLAVVVPELAPVESAKAEPAPGPAARKVEPRRRSTPERVSEPSGSGQRLVALGLGGVGAAALAFGVVEGLAYLNDNGDAKKLCPTSTNCTQDEIRRHGETLSDARMERAWALIGVGVGSAALVTATYLHFSAPSGGAPAKERAKLRLAPSFEGLGSYGARLLGAF